jgi:hypothetical protein
VPMPTGSRIARAILHRARRIRGSRPPLFQTSHLGRPPASCWCERLGTRHRVIPTGLNVVGLVPSGAPGTGNVERFGPVPTSETGWGYRLARSGVTPTEVLLLGP